MTNLDDFSKVGIFGGTFSPPHCGHLEIGLFVRDFLKVPIIYLPAVAPLHKDNVEASFDDRIKMAELLVQDYRHMMVSRYEAIISQLHTTIYVIRHLVFGCIEYLH